MLFHPVEHQSKDTIHDFQLTKLKEMLQYLKKHSPFYRILFEHKAINIDTLEQLATLPTTNKQAFAANNYDFLCCAKKDIADYCTTSGTTGNPVTVALHETDLERLAYNEARSFITAGCKAGDTFQLMLTLDRQFMAGMAYHLGIRKLGGAAIRSGAVSPQLQWENIQRFQPNVLVAVPSFILKMIEYAEANNIDLNTSGVERVICIGEPVRNADFTQNTLAERINHQWNVELFSTYASTEMQTAFTECSAHRGNHLRAELLIAEVLDDAGNPLPPNIFGELTITTLDVKGMPLLRYRTGDIVAYDDTPCSCGSNTMRITPVVGRKNQMIKYKGTTLFPTAIMDALGMVKVVSDYIIEVSKNELGTDEVHIHISSTDETEASHYSITSALQAKLRVTPSFSFVSAQRLQALRPTESRKPVRVIFK